jgi:hypothetical protein
MLINSRKQILPSGAWNDMQIDGVTDLFFSYGTFWILQELSWDSPTTKIDEEKQLISFFFYLRFEFWINWLCIM